MVGFLPRRPDPEAGIAFMRLFKESTIRGLHAFGGTQAHPDLVTIKAFTIDEVLGGLEPHLPTIAHARYCTSGDWRTLENNQPIVAASRALAFNGVIHMGTKEEFEAAFEVECQTDNDGEVFLRSMELGEPAEVFLKRIRGSFAGVWFDPTGQLWAGRNERRPLWKCEAFGGLWYASTKDIFRRAEFPEPTEVQPGVEKAA